MEDDKKPLAVRIAIFIGGWAVGFALACVCIFSGLGLIINATPRADLYGAIKLLSASVGFAGLVGWAFWKGQKILALGVILGAIAPFLALGACSMAIR